MAKTRTITSTFRIERGLKEALRAAAQREHRSIAKLVEVLIRDYCGKRGIAIHSPLAMDDNRDHSASAILNANDNHCYFFTGRFTAFSV